MESSESLETLGSAKARSQHTSESQESGSSGSPQTSVLEGTFRARKVAVCGAKFCTFGELISCENFRAESGES